MGILHKFPKQLRKPEGHLGKFIGFLMSRRTKAANDRTLALLDIQLNDKVLEIGFGPGLAIKKASEKAGFVAGIDFSNTMVKKASKLNAAAIKSGKVELRHGDATELHYKENSFDKVFSVNVIYFWDNPVAILKSIRKVMKYGGRIVIHAKSKRTLDKLKLTKSGVFKGYNADELVGLFRNAGFKNVKHEIKESKGMEGICIIAEK